MASPAWYSCCFVPDQGQSHTIGEVVADFLAEAWSGQLPGVFHERLSWVADDHGTPMTYDLFPSYDLERADCRPVPSSVEILSPCDSGCAGCDVDEYCWDGIRRST